jgi:hypothetical protein
VALTRALAILTERERKVVALRYLDRDGMGCDGQDSAPNVVISTDEPRE